MEKLKSVNADQMSAQKKFLGNCFEFSKRNKQKRTVVAYNMPLDSNGITLIALIITIIVMLILVGVTITVALNGGLFKTTQEAATNTIMEYEKEQLLSSVVGAIGTDGKVDSSKISLPEGFIKDESKSTETKLVVQGKDVLWQIELNSTKIEPFTDTPNVDISKVLSKAYTWENNENCLSIGYIVSSSEGNSLKFIVIDLITGKEPESDYNPLNIPITLSSDFTPITIYINNTKVDLNSQTAFIIESSERALGYITEEYLITCEVNDGDKLTTDHSNMHYSERNSTYDSYVL